MVTEFSRQIIILNSALTHATKTNTRQRKQVPKKTLLSLVTEMMVERKKYETERETEILGCKTPVPIEEFSGVFSLISQLQGVHYEKPLKKRSGS